MTALSEVAATVATVPEKFPAIVPSEPALVDQVGASETVKIFVPETVALPSGFSTLILYCASTLKVS